MSGWNFPLRVMAWNSREGLERGHSSVLEQASDIQAGEPWEATPSSVAPPVVSI